MVKRGSAQNCKGKAQHRNGIAGQRVAKAQQGTAQQWRSPARSRNAVHSNGEA